MTYRSVGKYLVTVMATVVGNACLCLPPHPHFACWGLLSVNYLHSNLYLEVGFRGPEVSMGVEVLAGHLNLEAQPLPSSDLPEKLYKVPLSVPGVGQETVSVHTV
jgi:hypothetical protein